MENTNKSAFTQVMSHEDNQTCFECYAIQPQWASINNGITVCLNCCSIHRAFGVQISLCRSITLDIWTEKQLKLLEVGGNQKLRDFCETYKLMEVDIQLRYHTKALDYYRRKNQSFALGQIFEEEPPSYEDGRCFLDGRKLDYEQNLPTDESEEQMVVLEPLDYVQSDEIQAGDELNFGNLKQGFEILIKQVQKDLQKEEVKQVTYAIGESTKVVVDKTQETFQKVAEFSKNTGVKIADFSKKSWEDTKKVSNDLGVTKVALEAGKQIKQGSLVVAGATVAGFSKIKLAMDNDQNLMKVKNDTKKGIQAADSFFKTFFKIDNKFRNERILSQVEISEREEEPRNNQES